MPAPQLTPPGHLDLHVVLVALTPAMLAATAGVAASIARGRVGRALGWVGMAASFALLALFLSPQGVAKAYTQPLAHGLVRVGWWQVVAALAAGLWTAWRWRPDAALRSSVGWGLRTMLALVMPMCALPFILIACEHDLRQVQAPEPGKRRWDRARPLAVIGLGAIAWWLLAAAAPPAWPTAAWAMAAACALAAASRGGPWRAPLALAAAAAALPLGG